MPLNATSFDCTGVAHKMGSYKSAAMARRPAVVGAGFSRRSELAVGGTWMLRNRRAPVGTPLNAASLDRTGVAHKMGSYKRRWRGDRLL